MLLSQRMHDVIWGPWVDDPIAKRNEALEWLKEVCQLEAEVEKYRGWLGMSHEAPHGDSEYISVASSNSPERQETQ